jgi:hypothetical protein
LEATKPLAAQSCHGDELVCHNNSFNGLECIEFSSLSPYWQSSYAEWSIILEKFVIVAAID